MTNYPSVKKLSLQEHSINDMLIIKKQFYKFIIGILLLTSLSSCTSISYYSQAVNGQIGLWWQQEKIDKLIVDRNTSQQLKNQFAKIALIRHFANDQLQLPVADNYSSYIDLKKPYVVWNVFATKELSVEPKKWCYLVIGCASYRGFFNEDDANEYAKKLRDQGYDVDVHGIIAYSTLGWFDDPVLSSFVHFPDWYLASLMFHELTHQLIYVRGDTMFNESFATAVEQIGLERWLLKNNNQAAFKKYKLFMQRKEQVIQLLLSYREKLAKLYESDLNDQTKRQQKRQLFSQILLDHQKLKHQWGGDKRFDGWFKQPLSNAQFAMIGDYYQLVPEFIELFSQNDQDFDRFYQAVKQLVTLDKNERRKKLYQPLLND